MTQSSELPRVWYLVRDFDRGRDFYKRLLGFDETFVDWDDKWSRLERGRMRIALAEGEPTMGGYSRCPNGTGAFMDRPLTDNATNNCP